MTADPGLVPCNRVISSSGNVFAIWPFSIFGGILSDWASLFRIDR